ncbi:MAG: four helix bundle protein [Verrucomicrobia bacterium]|nr:four helix bundle protein [Verrucomicrobiota bacterium]
MRQRFHFEKLEVWQEARKFKQAVYRASRSFPKEEMFALTSQLRRAAVSIASNIAEGQGCLKLGSGAFVAQTFQSAVAPVFQPASVGRGQPAGRFTALPTASRRYGRLKTCATECAGRKLDAALAEGSGRNSDRDFAHFLEQAYGALMEATSLLFLAHDEAYLTEEVCDALLEHADLTARRLVSLNRSLNVETSKTPFARRAPSPRPSTLDSRPISSP